MMQSFLHLGKVRATRTAFSQFLSGVNLIGCSNCNETAILTGARAGTVCSRCDAHVRSANTADANRGPHSAVPFPSGDSRVSKHGLVLLALRLNPTTLPGSSWAFRLERATVYPGRNLADEVMVRLLDRPDPGWIDVLRRDGLLLDPRFDVLVGVVPIPHVTFKTGNASVDVVSIRLGWAKTVVYKVQGESKDELIVRLPSKKGLPGVTLVAISRVRTEEGLLIARRASRGMAPRRGPAGCMSTRTHAVQSL